MRRLQRSLRKWTRLWLITALITVLLPTAPARADLIESTGEIQPSISKESPGSNEMQPRTWRVGPQRELKTPSDAAKFAHSGDTIEIDAGRYYNDHAHWRQHNLTIRGVNGMAHMASDHLIPNGKGIWIITGNNVRIENIEFSGARVHSTNGAGIRHNGGSLRLHNTLFHNNEFSVLTGPSAEGEILISDSRFWFQRRQTRWSHGIYIGNVKKFTLIGSHILGTDLGHQVKSRARENQILYNRIEDLAFGNSSRVIDLPNCGYSIVLGNEMQQGALTDNYDIIGYGAEGCEDRSAEQKLLYVTHNTLINAAENATLVRNQSDGKALVANNLIFGRASYLVGNGAQMTNIKLNLPGGDLRRWSAPLDSKAINQATSHHRTGAPVLPSREFDPPAGTRLRIATGRMDIGARERRGGTDNR